MSESERLEREFLEGLRYDDKFPEEELEVHRDAPPPTELLERDEEPEDEGPGES